MEAPDARWALGVQWHPEVDARSGVIAALVEEAGRRGAPGQAGPRGGAERQAELRH